MTTASSPHGFDAANPLSTLASSFGQAADVYERGRPSYPAEAVEWLLPLGARHVVDLGAGTGKLTRVLLPRVEQVTAVEPSEGMRATLERAVPDAASLAGSAESMPLDDSSVDAVFVAQAWHWVDPRAAVPEVARVLRPGGTLALLWNIRDETVPWLAELSQVMHSPAERDMSSDAPAVGEPFALIERRDFPWVHELGRDELLAMIASRSYVITLSEDDRAQVLRDVGQLLDTHPDTRGAETIRLPYVTRASRTLLPG